MLKIIRRIITNPLHFSSLVVYIFFFAMVVMLGTTEFGRSLFSEWDNDYIGASIELISEYLDGPVLYKFSSSDISFIKQAIVNIFLDNILDVLLIGFSVFLIKTIYAKYVPALSGNMIWVHIPLWADIIGAITGCLISMALDNHLSDFKTLLRPIITIIFVVIGILIMLFKSHPYSNNSERTSILNCIIIKLLLGAFSGIPSAICVSSIILIIYQMPQAIENGNSVFTVLVNGILGIAICILIREILNFLEIRMALK